MNDQARLLLDGFVDDGYVRSWQELATAPGSIGVVMSNGQLAELRNDDEAILFGWGVQSAAQAWRQVMGGRHQNGGKSPAEVTEIQRRLAENPRTG